MSTMYDSIYTILLKWQIYNNGEQISCREVKEEVEMKISVAIKGQQEESLC